GSPDGTHVSIVQAVCSDRWVVAGDLLLLDLASGTRTTIDTAHTDVTRLEWISSTRLGYFGQRHLDSVAGILDVATGEVSELFCTEMACGGPWYPDGAFTADGRVVTVQEAYDLPPQVVLTGGEKED